jgi:GPH family glycoside/pentoside/hexuronide:cation symporter
VSLDATIPAPPKRVPLINIVAFGSLTAPLAALLLMLGLFIPRYYVGLGAGFAAIGAAVGLVRIADIFLDPLLALVMDRTRTVIGRYRPWLVLGAPIAMFGAYKLMIPPPHPTAVYFGVWLLIIFAGTSMLTLALAAWSAILARNYHDRSRVFGWTQGMGVLGSVCLLLLPLFTNHKIVASKAASMSAICMLLLIALPIGMAITAIFTREKIDEPAERPRFAFKDYVRALARPNLLRVVLADFVLTLGPGMTGPIYAYFFHDAKGFSGEDVSFLLIFYIGAGILGAPFWARVARRFGKHRTIQIACVIYGITQTILMALPRVHEPYARVDILPTAVGMFAVGFCASAFLLLIRAMVADVCDEVKLEQKQDLTSLIFSMVTTTTKIGGSITTFVAFSILGLVHYNGKEGAVNTPHAVFGLEMCYLFPPIILVFFGGAMLFGYKLDAKRHGEIQAALEQEAASAHLAASEESLIGPTAGAAAE